MTRYVTSIKHHALTPEHFNLYPVWAWVDDVLDETSVYPLLMTDNNLPTEIGALFVKARITIPDQRVFDGKVMIDQKVFAVSIWYNERYYTINRYLTNSQIHMESLIDFEEKLGCDCLPLDYETDFKWHAISVRGEFDLMDDPPEF